MLCKLLQFFFKVLEKFCCDKHEWKSFADLKVMSTLLGQLSKFTFTYINESY